MIDLALIQEEVQGQKSLVFGQVGTIAYWC